MVDDCFVDIFEVFIGFVIEPLDRRGDWTISLSGESILSIVLILFSKIS